MTIKYPEVTVELTGTDANALSIVGKVSKALRRHGCTDDEIVAYQQEACSGDYDKILTVSMQTVDVI
tara:strand:- start:1127 stop:1327 length:201 start_codon:yes stop_codon:yes gene_type:complete